MERRGMVCCLCGTLENPLLSLSDSSVPTLLTAAHVAVSQGLSSCFSGSLHTSTNLFLPKLPAVTTGRTKFRSLQNHTAYGKRPKAGPLGPFFLSQALDSCLVMLPPWLPQTVSQPVATSYGRIFTKSSDCQKGLLYLYRPLFFRAVGRRSVDWMLYNSVAWSF